MLVKPYQEWEHIFLDTSIIINLLAKQKGSKDATCAFVHKLISDLSAVKNKNKKNRNFYVSTISVSELIDSAVSSRDKIKKTIELINSENVTFVPFDIKIASFLIDNYQSVLGKPKQNTIAKELSFLDHDLVLAREWISKDLMIIASADQLKCCTLLTTDKNTMLTLSEKVDYFCALGNEEHYQTSGNGLKIFNYNRPKSQAGKN